jgi:LuxR family maltose regulon positive regulatory protein
MLRTGRVIEVLVLQALIFHGNKDLDQALAVLEKALSLAQPEGYVRTFLDEGEPMAKLLTGQTGGLRQYVHIAV